MHNIFKLLGKKDLWQEKTPLFVIGAPRSGTTLLCRILRAHPLIWISNESGIFLQMHYLVKTAAERRPAGYGSRVESKELFKEWSTYLDCKAHDLITGFYQEMARQEGRNAVAYWGDKHPHHDVCIPSLQRWFPDSRFIYLVRNPLDATCSIAAMNQWKHERAFKDWNTISSNYEKHLPLIAPSRLFMLRYEDLALEPLNNIRRSFSWLDIASTAEIDAKVNQLSGIQSHSIGKDAESAAEIGGVKKCNPERSSIGRWEREMSEQDTLIIKERAAHYLTKYYPEVTIP